MNLAVIPHYPPYGGSLGPVTGFKTYLENSDEKYHVVSFRWGAVKSDLEEKGVLYFNYPWSIGYLKVIRSLRSPFHVYFRSFYTLDFMLGSLFKPKGVDLILSSSGKFMPAALDQRKFVKSITISIYIVWLKKVSAIYFQSSYERDEAPLNVVKSAVCRVIPQRFKVFDDPVIGDEIFLYTFSRVDPWKNLEGIVSRYAATDCNTPLNIIGPGEDTYLLRLQNFCRELGLQVVEKDDLASGKGVKFYGFMHKSDLSSLLSMYRSVFIQNSKSEGVSNSALEAVINGSVLCLNTAVSRHLEIEGVLNLGNMDNLSRIFTVDLVSIQKKQISSFRDTYVR